MPAGDGNVDKTYKAAYRSSANELSDDEHHQYGNKRARKSKWHKQQSGSSDSEHKESPPQQSR